MKILLITSLLVVKLCVLSLARADDDDAPPHAIAQNLQAALTVDEKTQRLAGIETLTLTPAQYRVEFTAYGKALSVQSLLALRHRYLALLAEHRSATAQFNQAQQSTTRQQALYNSGVTAQRTMQDQRVLLQTDKARLETTQVQTQALADEALLNWGETLAAWALANDADKLTDFVTGRQTLLQITLPANKQLAAGNSVIYVDSAGNRLTAAPAHFISVAPHTDASAQGISYFFYTSSPQIKAGMSVNAWLAEQNSVISGVIMPKSALIWSMNQAFVYVKIAADQFSRRPIKDYSVMVDGYFISTTLAAGEQIVSVGAQALLSEELRGQIPDDDD